MGRAERLAFAALMLLVAAVFWRHLFTADVLFLRDIVYSHFPRTVEIRSLVRSGLLPIWNPFEHFGEPAIANANYLLFYPTSWLAWVLPTAYGFKLHYILHFFLMAAGSFFLARRVGLGPIPCLVAGGVYVFSGPMMSLGNFYNLLPAAARMAPAILAADYKMRRGGWRGAAALAASLTLQLFAGEPFTSIVTVGLVAGWSVAFYGDLRAPAWAGVNRLVFLRLGSGLALTAALSAVQLLPALWHMRHTERAAQLTYLHTFFWSMHPLKFLEIMLPEFLGAWGVDEGLPWLYLEGSEMYFLLSMFIGIVPLALALAGVLGYGASAPPAAAAPRRAAILWTAAGAFAVLLSLGRYTPLSYVFYELIPIFRVVRFPVKFMLAAALAVAQLAALGSAYLLARTHAEPAALPPPPRALRWLSGGLMGLALGWIALSAFLLLWPETSRVLLVRLAAMEFDYARALRIGQVLLLNRGEILARAGEWLERAIPARIPYVLGSVVLMVAALDSTLRRSLRRRVIYAAAAAGILQLAFTHYWINPLADPRFFKDPVPALRHVDVKHAPSSARIFPVRIYGEPPFTLPNLPPVPIMLDVGELAFLPSTAQVLYTYRMSLQAGAGLLGLENSFTADPEHILLQHQSLVNKIAYDRVLTGEPLGRLLRLGSVEYAFFKRQAAPPGFEEAGSGANGTTLPVRVYRVPDPAPRAYLVAARDAVVLPAGMPTVHRLFSPEFDVGRHVVLERAVHGDAGGSTSRDNAAFAGEARLVRRDALNIEVRASASGPAYLVLTDSYNPDWKVTVDGEPAELLRANQMFRAVALAAGTHQVSLRYRPLSLAWGAAITLAAAMLTILLAARERKELRIPRI